MQRQSKSYRSILHASKALLWKHGLRRITVDEICREAGVSKMTFYRSFKNKQGVAEKVLANFLELAMQEYRDIMAQDIAFAEKIKQLIVLKYKSTTDLSEEFLKDIYEATEMNLHEQFEAYRSKMMKEVMDDFRIAQSKGYIKKELKIEFLMYMLNKLNERMLDDEFVAMYPNPQEAIMELINFFFYGVMQKQENEPVADMDTANN